jgi:hypothetical protein
MADSLLAHVLERDGGRPNDDMAVVALSLRSGDIQTSVRRLALEVHLP